MEVTLEIRETGRWASLQGAEARLSIPSLGLQCFWPTSTSERRFPGNLFSRKS
jgi:hypothetical protein